jgi:16S rRNA (cytosine1402-N4)-methyltransferase
VIAGLNPKEGDIVLDATLGGGGHSLEICKLIGDKGILVGIDQDRTAIERAEKVLAKTDCRKIMIKGNFRNVDTLLAEKGVTELDGALFDLGYSSDQLEQSGRGFSFQKNEPVLMTMDDDAEFTAQTILNYGTEADIEKILRNYGEETLSRHIAKAIVTARKASPIFSTDELVEVIRNAVPASVRNGKRHFATKTFQALRIAVNDEMEALRQTLEKAWQLLKPDGRIAVISFHSLEDRIVKNFLRNKKQEGTCEIVTKKPTVATREEARMNPRSRSAKLRIGIKK